uniref:Uncharacterized protein n=1 Tax=Anguilla anguilla TaxID=7936 RepID=A0A0E9R0T2_ANGAN
MTSRRPRSPQIWEGFQVLLAQLCI